MKVIDLLNKIANGERPKKFKLHIYTEDFIYELSDNGGYYEINTDEEFTESINLIFCLNDEVEIIEDTPKEDKKIEKFKVIKDNSEDSVELIYNGMKLELTLLQAIILDKINEIIDYMNGGENERNK
jgi:hypothetical protein